MPPSFLDRRLLRSETLTVLSCRAPPSPRGRAAGWAGGLPPGAACVRPLRLQHDVETRLRQLFGFLITAPQKASGPWRMSPCSRVLSAAPSPAALPQVCPNTPGRAVARWQRDRGGGCANTGSRRPHEARRGPPWSSVRGGSRATSKGRGGRAEEEGPGVASPVTSSDPFSVSVT